MEKSNRKTFRYLALSIILLLLSMAGAGCIGGKSVVARGEVITFPPDEGGAVPVYDAQVTINGRSMSTGYDGKFALAGAVIGLNRIWVTKPGYEPYTASVRVSADGTISDPVEIKPLSGDNRCAVRATVGGISGPVAVGSLYESVLEPKDSVTVLEITVELTLEEQESGDQYTAGTKISIEHDGSTWRVAGAGTLWLLGVESQKTYSFTGTATVTSAPLLLHVIATVGAQPTVKIEPGQATVDIPFDLGLSFSLGS